MRPAPSSWCMGRGTEAWCWRRVADVLMARGHRVFAPTLTGVGDRAHLFSKDISLQTHVEDILAVVETEELSDFVLVGHSYVGFVISGVADALRSACLTMFTWMVVFHPICHRGHPSAGPTLILPRHVQRP
jgi:thioesterase domain-containing protein